MYSLLLGILNKTKFFFNTFFFFKNCKVSLKFLFIYLLYVYGCTRATSTCEVRGQLAKLAVDLIR